MHRPTCIAVSLTLGTVLTLAAQAAPESRPLGAEGTLALADAPLNRERVTLVERARFAALLPPAYSLHLVSDWPQYGIAGTSCVNGGSEVITGTLTQGSGGEYGGVLERRATIRFCGSHGTAQDEHCSLTLTSHGPVAARGEVAPTEGSGPGALLTVRWSARPDAAPDDVAIEGDCAPAFKTSLRNLYLGVQHALEFPVPLRGEPARLVRLDQGWFAEAW